MEGGGGKFRQNALERAAWKNSRGFVSVCRGAVARPSNTSVWGLLVGEACTGVVVNTKVGTVKEAVPNRD